MDTNKHGIDLTKLSLEALNELEQDIPLEKQRRLDEDRETELERVRQVAEKHGLSLEEFLQQPARKSRPRTKRPQKRYQNPDNPEEIYSGRGPRPEWLSAKLRAGQQIEEFEMSE